MSRRTIYLTCFGELFALTTTAYKRYLTAVSQFGFADLGDFGTRLTGRVCNVTDITRDEAALILSGGRVSALPPLKED